MLWVDKYRPKSLLDLDTHPEVTTTLTHLVKQRDFPHLLVYGPSGSGKRTRVMALLRAHYGDAVASVRMDQKSVQVTESKAIDIATLSSPHHVDLNPSDAGPTYDRAVVMHTIRDIASSSPLNVSPDASPFKVVVLNEVDKLSRGAQQALRRTMERYIATCRLILICESASRLIPPLRSRCLSIRVPGHSDPEVAKSVTSVLKLEGIESVNEMLALKIARLSEGNLRRALLMAEAAKMAKVDFKDADAGLPVAEWRQFITEIARDIQAEQTPKKLHEVRGKFYELLAQAIPPDTIMRELVKELLRCTPPMAQLQIAQFGAVFDRNCKMGSKPIMHLEAFAANVMAVLKRVSQQQ